jgi:glycosyltransferase involved in cell wall biosynthesis
MVAFTNYTTDTRVRREAEALAQRGDEVDFICPGTASLGGRRSLNGVALHPVRRVDYTSSSRPRDYVRRYAAFHLAAFSRLLWMQLRRPYDVVHVNTMPDALVFSAAGAKLLGAKVILDVHDLMPELYASRFEVGERHPAIRLLTMIERRSVGFADRAIAVHVPHLDALVRHGNPRDKFSILMNVPDSALFRPRSVEPPESPFTLIYHGTIGSRHGLDVAVRAAALAREAVPDLELRIIGDGDFSHEVRALIVELGVQDFVRLDQGFVPMDELLPTMEQASVGLAPILDDPFTRYMLPVKLLEYVALGIPVIASDTESVRAYFDESMLCFAAPGDPSDLARKMIEMRDPERRARLVASARRFNEEHTWEHERGRYLSLVDSLVRSNGRRAIGPWSGRARPARPSNPIG